MVSGFDPQKTRRGAQVALARVADSPRSSAATERRRRARLGAKHAKCDAAGGPSSNGVTNLRLLLLRARAFG
jgi:hypothetical protein